MPDALDRVAGSMGVGRDGRGDRIWGYGDVPLHSAFHYTNDRPRGRAGEYCLFLPARVFGGVWPARVYLDVGFVTVAIQVGMTVLFALAWYHALRGIRRDMNGW